MIRLKNYYQFSRIKKVSDLIKPKTGIVPELDRRVDFALHDLMGIILNQPVYKLIGNRGTKQVPLYSGMIYLDELNPGNETKGIDAIIENCQWDVDYGYRQLKVKIGRSGRWYQHDEGLARDIEVVKLIHDTFKDQGVEVLVDANDMYSMEDTKKFLEGIGDTPLFWVEEPFIEEVKPGKELRQWMDQNGFEKTYYADGERNPDFDVCLELGKDQHMDVFLPDTYSYGFTKWIKLMPDLEKMNMLASPHAWGNRLKTNYTIHLAAGLGNICTVEGVTCLSDDIDYGDYPIVDGKVRVSEAPGFGMKLLRQ
jgi:L-alanine-DL-glutamate epimerase-like enolase superfamily enzyme